MLSLLRPARIIVVVLGLTLVAFHSTPAYAFNANILLSDFELTDHSSMSSSDIESFLTERKSGLAGRSVTSSGERASTVIARSASESRINPKVLLVLLQKEQSLIDNPAPSAKQLKWAMGYGVCDSCSLSDPGVVRFAGFETQVNSAAQLLRYLIDNPQMKRIRKGVATLIDNTTVIPQSEASAALYTYTPHIHGNLVFWALWNRWFDQQYLDGALLKAPNDPTVWYIQYGTRRAIQSLGVLRSRFGNRSIVTVLSNKEIEKYPKGPAVELQNFSLVRSPNGAIQLIDGDEYHLIPSTETFRLLGFNPEEIIEVSDDLLRGYTRGSDLSASSLYPTGALLQNTSGGVFFVQDGKKHPIIDRALLKQFTHLRVTRASEEELNHFERSTPVVLPDGTLVKSSSSGSVYLVSKGSRNHIASENAFTTLGFDWKKIQVVPERVLALHEIGKEIDIASADIPSSDPRPQLR